MTAPTSDVTITDLFCGARGDAVTPPASTLLLGRVIRYALPGEV